MPIRFVSLLLFLFVVPAISQQTATIQNRISTRIQQREDAISRVSSGVELDPKLVRMEMLRKDVTDLTVLSAAVQSDLAQLQKGVLPKDLTPNLKKMEKLSKKVRQEMQ